MSSWDKTKELLDAVASNNESTGKLWRKIGFELSELREQYPSDNAFHAARVEALGDKLTRNEVAAAIRLSKLPAVHFLLLVRCCPNVSNPEWLMKQWAKLSEEISDEESVQSDSAPAPIQPQTAKATESDVVASETATTAPQSSDVLSPRGSQWVDKVTAKIKSPTLAKLLYTTFTHSDTRAVLANVNKKDLIELARRCELGHIKQTNVATRSLPNTRLFDSEYGSPVGTWQMFFGRLDRKINPPTQVVLPKDDEPFVPDGSPVTEHKILFHGESYWPSPISGLTYQQVLAVVNLLKEFELSYQNLVPMAEVEKLIEELSQASEAERDDRIREFQVSRKKTTLGKMRYDWQVWSKYIGKIAGSKVQTLVWGLAQDFRKEGETYTYRESEFKREA